MAASARPEPLPAYELTRSRRRTVALIVHPDDRIEVRCPLRYPVRDIEAFIRQKADWIARKRQANRQRVTLPPVDAVTEQLACDQTRQLVQVILQGYDGPLPARVVIRRQKSRWGSCSSRGSIAINSRAAALPRPLVEYIVYHELCHLVHLNHGPRFWELLQRYLPDARLRQKALRAYHFAEG